MTPDSLDAIIAEIWDSRLSVDFQEVREWADRLAALQARPVTEPASKTCETCGRSYSFQCIPCNGLFEGEARS